MFEKYKNFFPIEADKWNEFVSYFHRMEMPSKTMLLYEGKVSSKAYVIEKGCLRAWVNMDGMDKTCQFFFEKGMVSSIESLRKNIPSLINIETVEPCVVWAIAKVDVEKILTYIDEKPELRKLFYNVIFERMFVYMKHHLSFITDTPTQRYQALVSDYPQIILRVPQHYIASYLGVSSVHLSRIKNGFAKNNTSSI